MRDGGKDSGWPCFDVAGRKSKDPNALLRQPSGPALVTLARVVMNRAIDLDAEFRTGAVKIEDKWTDRMLAAEMQAGGVAPEQRPEQRLALRHRAAE